MPDTPEDLYPPDEDRPAPVEDVPFDPDEGVEKTVEVSQQELANLGEFLTAMQQVIINIQERLLNVEKFLSKVFGDATEQESEMDPDAPEGEDPAGASNAPELHVVGDPGDESNDGGTEVPSDPA